MDAHRVYEQEYAVLFSKVGGRRVYATTLGVEPRRTLVAVHNEDGREKR